MAFVVCDFASISDVTSRGVKVIFNIHVQYV